MSRPIGLVHGLGLFGPAYKLLKFALGCQRCWFSELDRHSMYTFSGAKNWRRMQTTRNRQPSSSCKRQFSSLFFNIKADPNRTMEQSGSIRTWPVSWQPSSVKAGSARAKSGCDYFIEKSWLLTAGKGYLTSWNSAIYRADRLFYKSKADSF